jgi:hypothetical protein
MTRMSADTVARLRLAVADSDVVDRYRSHIKTGRADECWWWTGAISGEGHGQFQIADQRLTRPGDTTPAAPTWSSRTASGTPPLNGVDALLQVPVLAHRCDNPTCQNPGAGGNRITARRAATTPTAATWCAARSPTPAVPAAGPRRDGRAR